MIVRTEGNVVALAGELTEETSTEEIGKALMALHARFGSPVTVDCGAIDRGSSSGLMEWIRLVTQLGFPIAYQNVPIWLVEQFSVITDFFVTGSVVTSLKARFFDPDEGDLMEVTLAVGSDVPILESYESLTVADLRLPKPSLEPDFEMAHYFGFLSAFYTPQGSSRALSKSQN